MHDGDVQSGDGGLLDGLFFSAFGGPETYLSPTVFINRISSRSGSQRSMWKNRVAMVEKTIKEGTPVSVNLGRGFKDHTAAFPKDREFVTAGFSYLTSRWVVKDGDVSVLLVKGVHAKAGGEPWMAKALSTAREPVTVTGNGSSTMGVNQVLNGEETAANTSKLLSIPSRVAEGDVCETCDKFTPNIYQEGWACGTPGCNNVTKDNQGHSLVSRTFRSEFLLPPKLMPAQITKPYPPLVREPPAPYVMTTDMTANKKFMRDFWRGSYCHTCNTMSRFTHFTKRVCEGCNKTTTRRLPTIPYELHTQGISILDCDTYQLPDVIINDSYVKALKGEFKGLWSIFRFPFYDGAEVILLRPVASVHTIIKEWSAKLQELENDGLIDSQRVPLDHPGGRDNYSRHGVFKVGNEYHAGYGPGTVPFKDAPPLFSEMRDFVEKVIRKHLGIDIHITEGVLCWYLTGMAMNAHSDGEKGLGTDVASLSFDGPARMSWFMKNEYECGKTGAKEITPTPGNPFLPGSQKRDECLALLERKKKGELTDERYTAELIEILKTTTRRCVRSPLRVLQLMIQSGDILLQHLHGMQKWYLVSEKKAYLSLRGELIVSARNRRIRGLGPQVSDVS
jgi:hypothetical protein